MITRSAGIVESSTAHVLRSSRRASLVELMVTGIKQIIVGERSVKELGGPVTIGKYAGEQLSMGPLAVLQPGGAHLA